MDTVFFDSIIKTNDVVLVDFYADWCEPCKMLDTIINELSAIFKEKIFTLKVDADQSEYLKQQFGIMSVPVLMLFKKGELVWRMNGFLMTSDLEKKIAEFI
jgi:thioredoxin 1